MDLSLPEVQKKVAAAKQHLGELARRLNEVLGRNDKAELQLRRELYRDLRLRQSYVIRAQDELIRLILPEEVQAPNQGDSPAVPESAPSASTNGDSQVVRPAVSSPAPQARQRNARGKKARKSEAAATG